MARCFRLLLLLIAFSAASQAKEEDDEPTAAPTQPPPPMTSSELWYDFSVWSSPMEPHRIHLEFVDVFNLALQDVSGASNKECGYWYMVPVASSRRTGGVTVAFVVPADKEAATVTNMMSSAQTGFASRFNARKAAVPELSVLASLTASDISVSSTSSNDHLDTTMLMSLAFGGWAFCVLAYVCVMLTLRRFYVKEFKAADVNQDRRLSRQEWIARFGTDQGFDAFDQDQSGEVDELEYSAAWAREFSDGTVSHHASNSTQICVSLLGFALASTRNDS